MATHPELPWYRVPLLWLGIAILLISLAASVHLIVVSRSSLPEHGPGQDMSFRGVPLTDGAAKTSDSGDDRNGDHDR